MGQVWNLEHGVVLSPKQQVHTRPQSISVQAVHCTTPGDTTVCECGSPTSVGPGSEAGSKARTWIFMVSDKAQRRLIEGVQENKNRSTVRTAVAIDREELLSMQVLLAALCSMGKLRLREGIAYWPGNEEIDRKEKSYCLGKTIWR